MKCNKIAFFLLLFCSFAFPLSFCVASFERSFANPSPWGWGPTPLHIGTIGWMSVFQRAESISSIGSISNIRSCAWGGRSPKFRSRRCLLCGGLNKMCIRLGIATTLCFESRSATAWSAAHNCIGPFLCWVVGRRGCRTPLRAFSLRRTSSQLSVSVIFWHHCAQTKWNDMTWWQCHIFFMFQCLLNNQKYFFKRKVDCLCFWFYWLF